MLRNIRQFLFGWRYPKIIGNAIPLGTPVKMTVSGALSEVHVIAIQKMKVMKYGVIHIVYWPLIPANDGFTPSAMPFTID